MKDFIRLDSVKREGDRFGYSFSSSLPYFRHKSFFIEYENSKPGDHPGLISIPFAATMAPVAWAAGARLEMPVLDRAFAESLEACRRRMQKWFFRTWSFDWILDARLVDHSFSPERDAMLFSSGLDSLTTYVCHRDKKPILYTIFGADIPVSHRNFIGLCRQRFDAFALSQNAEIRFISTDLRETLDFAKLRRFASNWYGEVGHGLMMSSLVAPDGFDTVKRLIIASCSHRPGCSHPCGSEKALVESIRWGNTTLLNENEELSRSEKIGAFLKGHEELYSNLRVCWMQFESLNCSRCEKCLRTICELLLNSIDPADCNFTIGASTLPALKRRIMREYYTFLRGETTLDFWRNIQDSVDLERIVDLYGSREFFCWLAGYDRLKRKQHPLLLAAGAHYLDAKSLAGRASRPVRRWAQKTADSAWAATRILDLKRARL